jgi:hypothetical protein
MLNSRECILITIIKNREKYIPIRKIFQEDQFLFL